MRGVGVYTQTVGAKLHLSQRFLSGDVQNRGFIQVPSEDGHESAFPDAGVVGQENQRSGNDTAAEHPVELYNPCR